MANRDILAIGASAGGVEALTFLAKQFRQEFPASVLVTIHLPSHAGSALDEVLSLAGHLQAGFARDREVLQKGRIYVAPPNRHLLLDGDRVVLGAGARENNVRPAIDSMLRSAAACCGFRAIGVVLTGTLGDGASGLWTLRQAGGITVVQDPRDAAFSEMPLAALNRAKPDHVVGLADMPALLDNLVLQPAGQPKPIPPSIKLEKEIAGCGGGNMDEMDAIGRRSARACPRCGRIAWEIGEDDMSHCRCRAGHAYAAELMGLALDENLGRALASASRVLEERVALARRLERQAIRCGHRLLAETWAETAQDHERQVGVIRSSIRRLSRFGGHSDEPETAA
jgi:two-component system chemotaxis response regulator CheB